MSTFEFSLVARGIYGSIPPDPRSSIDNKPTLLVCWWCTAVSLVIILIRVVGRYCRTERFFTEDKLMIVGVIPLIARMTLVHLVLVWGTNNTKTAGLSESDIYNREVGSRLVVAARIFYAVYIWMAKYTVCEFLRRLTGMVWTRTFQIALRSIEYFLASTLAAVVIATLVECDPFDHYWQVVPDPGPHCRLGYANLLTMGVCDMLTDIFLVVLPVSLFLASTITVKQKIQLTLIFASSLVLVAITGYRVPSVIQQNGIQNFRSLVASFEILAATAISNFVVIGSFIRDRGLKKARYKREEGSLSAIDSVDHASARRVTLTKHHWGSDADLVDGLGIRLAPELHAVRKNVIRPAPMIRGLSQSDNGPDRIESLTMTGSSTVTRSMTAPVQLPIDESVVKVSPRRVSFYDVGGLLNDSTLPTQNPTENLDNSQHPTESETSYSPLSPGPSSMPFQIPRYGSREHSIGTNLFLHDVGGLITAPNDVSSNSSATATDQPG